MSITTAGRIALRSRRGPGPAAGRSSSLTRSAARLTPALMVANVAGYLLAVIAGRRLGSDGYGAFTALLGVLLVASVPALAVQAVVARRTAAAPDDAGTTAWARNLGRTVGLATTVAVLVAALPLIAFLHLRRDGLAVVAIALGCWPFALLCAEQGLLQGRDDLGRLARVVTMVGVAKLIGGVLPMAAGLGVSAALLGITVGTGAAWAFARRSAGPAAAPAADAAAARELIAAISGLGALLVLANLDVLLARHVLTSHAAGHYAAGSVVAKAAFWLPQAVAVAAFPHLADPAKHAEVLRGAVRVVLGVGALVTVGTMIAGPLMVRIAFGSAYREIGGRLWLFAAQGTALAVVQLLLYGGIARADRSAGLLVALACAAEAAVVLLAVHHVIGVIVTAAITAAVLAITCSLRLSARRPGQPAPR